MTWTREQIELIPPVYRDFMLALTPVVDSKRDPSRVIRITGVPLIDIYHSLFPRYRYPPKELRELVSVLKSEGLIDEDSHGFFTPTAKGESLIDSLLELEQAMATSIPAFPALDQ